MVFSSLLFLFRFLPVMLLVYFAVPVRFCNGVLFIGSLIFYGWGEPVYSSLLLFSTAVDHVHGRLIWRFREAGNERAAKSVGIKPWQQDVFDRRVVTEEFHGTIYSKLNFPWEFDIIETWIPKELREYKVSFDGESATSDYLYFYDALKGKDKYAVYLDGNHAITKIVNEAADGDLRKKNRC